jgi:hypothetical protein
LSKNNYIYFWQSKGDIVNTIELNTEKKNSRLKIRNLFPILVHKAITEQKKIQRIKYILKAQVQNFIFIEILGQIFEKKKITLFVISLISSCVCRHT